MIKDEIFIVSHHGCPPCEALARAMAKAKKDRIPIYDIASSDEALDLLLERNELAVPIAFYRDGGKVKKCQIRHSGDKIIIDCGKEHLEFTK